MRIGLPLLMSACLSLLTPLAAQETFSIVAVDTITGEVGSAGASCLDDQDVAGGATIISDVLPGRGAVHTQARYRAGNQRRARERVQEGLSADSVIQWLKANDAFFSPEVRQYGIALLKKDGTYKAQTAAFTGDDTDSFKGHYTGRTYAIQGNILKGPEVLDSMRSAFLRTGGSLGERLMAALQGANMPGADRRCLEEGVSSQSAFLRVAKPGDPREQLTLDLAVTQTPTGVEPIDSLQVLFDDMETETGTYSDLSGEVAVRQGMGQGQVTVHLSSQLAEYQQLRLEILDLKGRIVHHQQLHTGLQTIRWPDQPGRFYVYRIAHSKNRLIKAGMLMPF
jgi:uncharacterized Ntn-hydrolase superfamily protein